MFDFPTPPPPKVQRLEYYIFRLVMMNCLRHPIKKQYKHLLYSQTFSTILHLTHYCQFHPSLFLRSHPVQANKIDKSLLHALLL